MKNIVELIVVFVLTLIVFSNKSFSQTKAIKVEKVGKGEVVLFLPGFTNPGTIWKETSENLKTKGEYHFFSYAGFNGIKPIEMPWYETIKKSVLDYIQDNKLKDLTIIGHSMGGTLGIDIAAEIPSTVKKLIIVDALPNLREVMMPGVPVEQIIYDSAYNKQMLKMSDAQFKGMASMMASNMTLRTDKVEMLSNWRLEADRKTYVYGYTDLLKLDLRPVLKKIKAKTHILAA